MWQALELVGRSPSLLVGGAMNEAFLAERRETCQVRYLSFCTFRGRSRIEINPPNPQFNHDIDVVKPHFLVSWEVNLSGCPKFHK